MSAKIFVIFLAVLLVHSVAVASGLSEKQQAKAIPISERGQLVLPQPSKGGCTLAKHDGYFYWYADGWLLGDGAVSYFDPAVHCFDPVYPLEIMGVKFYLYNYDDRMHDKDVTIDVVIYGVDATGDSCLGPDVENELCRVTITTDQIYPGLPDYISDTAYFPEACIVDGPFFAGIEYVNCLIIDGEYWCPSLMFDNVPIDTCQHFGNANGEGYFEWYDFWEFSPGDIMISVLTVATEACCFPDGSCADLAPGVCLSQGGTLQGPGTECTAVEACCLSDGACMMADPICCDDLGGTPQGPGTQCTAVEACCFPDNTCQDLDPLCCAQMGGTPSPWGASACAGDGNGDGTDDACEVPAACCFTNGTCANMLQAVCENAGGDYQGDGTVCLGDGNGNSTDDACEGWQPGDPYKMHAPQYPDEVGWDVNATYPMILADDWQCTETGWVKDIHFWGSWLAGGGVIDSFTLSIHADIPGDPGQDIPSKPADPALWEWVVTDFDFFQIIREPWLFEGAYFPRIGFELQNATNAYYQYDVTVPQDMWFWQEADTIYWLNITAHPHDEYRQWGWKSSWYHFTDDAVWKYEEPGTAGEWTELYQPAPSRESIFEVVVDQAGEVLFGTGDWSYGQGWYYYENDNWWNIWFYDHPFDSNRYKTVHIEMDVVAAEPFVPGELAIAVNWSTDLWSLEGNPYPQSRRPPLPPLTPQEELDYLNREILIPIMPVFDDLQHLSLDYMIEAYNPEWISVDVRGFNFVIIPESMIRHECLPKAGTEPTSLDLSFVITGDATGGMDEACCFTDGTCQDLDRATCLSQGGTPQGANTSCSAPAACCLSDGTCLMADPVCCDDLGGTPQGPGTQCTALEACCLSDGTCIMADPVCCDDLGGTPQGPGTECTAVEACCLSDGTCIMVDPICCDDLGGTPQGSGTQCNVVEACCLSDGACIMADPICCDDLGGTPQGPGTQCSTPKACCFPDNTCQDVDPLCCAQMGGTPSPWGASTCQGDANGDGIDDACQVLGACCFNDGTCADMEQAACENAAGDYQADGTTCLGDRNSNGTDDACEGWQPGDPYKMHSPQYPDEAGWDVKATQPMVLADDWRCTETGWVQDIHFWGSWKDGVEGQIEEFVLSIHRDIPASQSSTEYSMPGELLWEYHSSDFSMIPIESQIWEGWYDPEIPNVLFNNHNKYYQYNIYIPESQWFLQRKDTIYWLNISAILPPGMIPKWGWKSSYVHYNDGATWTQPGSDWIEMFEPRQNLVNDFSAYLSVTNQLVEGFGAFAYGEGWYYYPIYEWWNVWFYDHPYDPDRKKVIHIELDVEPTQTSPGYLELAVNWSTPVWSLEANPLPERRVPPLPDPSWSANEEDTYIGRHSLFADNVSSAGHLILDYEITDFNPEWISVDIRGSDVSILEGWIDHLCLPKVGDDPQSLDLSFVITGEGDTCLWQTPGDVDNDGDIDNDDVTYLKNFLYAGGPTPPVMPNADPNGDCWVDDADILYLDAWLKGTGTAPVECTCVDPTVCDCLVGDANGDGGLNIGDAVYVGNIVFRPGSPAPQPYDTCSGDANFDCTVNIGDAVFIGNIVFRPGSSLPPCCHTWATDPTKGCGLPLHKRK